MEVVGRVGRDNCKAIAELGIVAADFEHSFNRVGGVIRFVVVKRQRRIAPVAGDMDIFDADNAAAHRTAGAT